jgi:hypothetical protein
MYAEALNEIAFTNSITSPAYINLNAVNKRAGNSDIDVRNT